MDGVLHLEQPLRLLFDQPGHRNPGPGGHDVGDVVRGDGADIAALLALPGRLQFFQLLAQHALFVAQLRGFLEILILDRFFLLAPDALDFLHGLADLLRQEGRLQADLAAGFVHQVDGLVRQEPVRDVLLGQGGRRDQRLVADGDAVMGLIALAQPFQDFDRLFDTGLADQDGLEAPLQGGIPLDVLPVFVQRRRPDALQFTAGQGGLQDITGIDGALRRAGADQGVQFVDEQHHLVLRLADLVHHLLHALLELAAVLRAGDQRREIQLHHALVAEDLGDVPAHDALRQPLRDGGLADARLADEGRIVLGAPGEDLNDTLDLAVAADDRIQLALPGQFRQVAAKLVQGRCLAGLLGVGGGPLFSQQVDDLRANALEVGAHRLQDARRHPLPLTDQSQQEMFGADIVVTQPACFVEGQFQHFLGPWGERDFLIGSPLATADGGFDLGAHAVGGDIQALQNLAGDPLTFADDPQQDMLGTDRAVVEALGFFLGQNDDPPGALCKSLKHCDDVPLSARLWVRMPAMVSRPLRGAKLSGGRG